MFARMDDLNLREGVVIADIKCLLKVFNGCLSAAGYRVKIGEVECSQLTEWVFAVELRMELERAWPR